jgi:hypothetical protein
MGLARAWGVAGSLTEADAGVLLADLVAVVVGEEHVGRETTLGGVGVCDESAHIHVCVDASNMGSWSDQLTLLAALDAGLLGGLAGGLLLRHFVCSGVRPGNSGHACEMCEK